MLNLLILLIITELGHPAQGSCPHNEFRGGSTLHYSHRYIAQGFRNNPANSITLQVPRWICRGTSVTLVLLMPLGSSEDFQQPLSHVSALSAHAASPGLPSWHPQQLWGMSAIAVRRVWHVAWTQSEMQSQWQAPHTQRQFTPSEVFCGCF